MRRILSLALLFAGALRADTALVLSFFNHATSANLDWVGESIAQSVRDSLASEGILVLDREDRLEAYRRLSLRPGAELTHASILKIGESLDASQVVYGYYELLPAEPGNAQSKGSLRITARILDLKHTRQGGVYSELGALEDLGSLATHLGWQTLEWLNPHGAPGEREFMNALAGNPPGLADARMAQSPRRSRRARVHERPSGGAPGCGRKLRARPALHFARAAAPLLHASRPVGRALLATLLPAWQEFLGKEGLQGGRRMAGARGPFRPALPGSPVFPRPEPLRQWRFQGRRRELPTGGCRGSPQRGL